MRPECGEARVRRFQKASRFPRKGQHCRETPKPHWLISVPHGGPPQGHPSAISWEDDLYVGIRLHCKQYLLYNQDQRWVLPRMLTFQLSRHGDMFSLKTMVILLNPFSHSSLKDTPTFTSLPSLIHLFVHSNSTWARQPNHPRPLGAPSLNREGQEQHHDPGQYRTGCRDKVQQVYITKAIGHCLGQPRGFLLWLILLRFSFFFF